MRAGTDLHLHIAKEKQWRKQSTLAINCTVQLLLFLGAGWQGRTEGLEISDKSIDELLIKEQEYLVNSAFNNYL